MTGVLFEVAHFCECNTLLYSLSQSTFYVDNMEWGYEELSFSKDNISWRRKHAYVIQLKPFFMIWYQLIWHLQWQQIG